MSNKIRFVLFFIIFLVGFSGLGLELLAMRQLSSFVGSTSVVSSIIIGVYLVFMSFGYYHGAVLKTKNYTRHKIAVDFLLIALMTLLSGSYFLIYFYFVVMNGLGIHNSIAQTFLYSLVFLSFAPYLFGKIVAVSSRYLGRHDSNYTGKIMACDTIGSVLGSIAITLIIMPLIGVNYTIIVLMCAGIIGAVLLSGWPSFIWGIILLGCAVLMNNSPFLYTIFGIVENNNVSTISILETKQNSKIMTINNGLSSKISPNADARFEYVKFVEDNFIKTIPTNTIKNILIVGAGGFTMGLEDSHNSYTFIDIDERLKAISEKYFLNEPLTPNKTFIVQDANQFLNKDTAVYDLIVLDTYSSLHYIPEDLITQEYFLRAKNRLKPNGIIVLNVITSPNFDTLFAQKIENTLRAVFPYNLRAYTVEKFNGWCTQNCPAQNIMYVYYNRPASSDIYTINKNTAMYDR